MRDVYDKKVKPISRHPDFGKMVKAIENSANDDDLDWLQRARHEIETATRTLIKRPKWWAEKQDFVSDAVPSFSCEEIAGPWNLPPLAGLSSMPGSAKGRCKFALVDNEDNLSINEESFSNAGWARMSDTLRSRQKSPYASEVSLNIRCENYAQGMNPRDIQLFWVGGGWDNLEWSEMGVDQDAFAEKKPVWWGQPEPTNPPVGSRYTP
jgi:hypothetical protein